MMIQKTILVTGATGRQGGSVARYLLAKGQNVCAMTRRPEKARELADMGMRIVCADFAGKESLREAVRGVGGVFLMGSPHERGPRAEAEEGKAVVEACRDARVPHLVYSSACGANRHTGIPHFESKNEVERAIRASGRPYTILRPVFFMQNFESAPVLARLRDGELSLPLSPDRPLQMIDVSDIGEFAAEAFLRPADFRGEEIDLAGDECTLQEVADGIGRAMGRPVRYDRIPDDRAREALGPDLAAMYRWLEQVGYDVDIGALRRRRALPLTSFPDYLGRAEFARRKAA